MYCTKCGEELTGGAKFCTACGAPVNAPTSAAATAPLAPTNVTEALPDAAFMPQTPEPLYTVDTPAVSDRFGDKGPIIRGVLLGVVCAAVVLGIAALFLLFQGCSSDASAEKEMSIKSAKIASSSTSAESASDETEAEPNGTETEAHQDGGAASAPAANQSTSNGSASNGGGVRHENVAPAPQQPQEQPAQDAWEDDEEPEVITNSDGSVTYRFGDGTVITLTPEPEPSEEPGRGFAFVA